MVATVFGGPASAPPNQPSLPQAHVAIGPEDVDAAASYTYTIDETNGEIDVSITIDLVLQKRATVEQGQTINLALINWRTAVPVAAVDVAAFDDRGPLQIDVARSGTSGPALAKINLGRRIFAGRKHRVTVTYSLPEHRISTDGETPHDVVVVNDAASAWLFATDPNFDRWTAELVAPARYEFANANDPASIWTLSRPNSTINSWTTHGASTGIDFVVFEDSAKLDEISFEIGSREITVRHWPGDTGWRDLVVDQITKGLPTLIELLGNPPPNEAKPGGIVTVQQSARTLGTSYGGWYTADQNTITIGPVVDDTLVLHELAHLWFNYGQLNDRWVIEGLAEEFASIAAFGTDDGARPSVEQLSPYRRPLKDWRVDDPTVVDQREEGNANGDRLTSGSIDWAYEGSWHVVHQIRNELGLDAFSRLAASLLAGKRSYSQAPTSTLNHFISDRPAPSAPPASGATAQTHWTEFLDLAIEHSGADDEDPEASTDDVLTALFAEWVEGARSARFEQRSEARARYRVLLDRTEGWTAPEAVREPMRAWSFGEADEAMDATDEFLNRADGMQSRLLDNELSMPITTGELLAGTQSSAEIAELADRLEAATDEVVNVEHAATDLSLIERAGLIGFDLTDARRQVRRSFVAGDLDGAAEAALSVESAIDGAESTGYLRMAGSGLATLALLAVAAAMTARPRRRQVGQTVSSDSITTSQRSRQSRQR